MNELVQEFNRQNLLEQLTPDQFFTAALLKRYENGSRVRQDGLQRVLTAAANLEEDPDYFSRGSKTLTHLNMPIYSDLTDWVTQIYAKSGEFVESGKGLKPGTDKNRPKGRDEPGLLEHANYADDKSNPNNLRPIKGNFNRPVTRSENFGVPASSGIIYPYLALQSPCENCPHKPPCRSMKCSKCQMLGHVQKVCHQRPGGDGKIG